MIDLLIDLDNTVYCESSKIFSQIDKKMKDFISNKLINELKLKDIKNLIDNGIVYGGMIPKVNTCI